MTTSRTEKTQEKKIRELQLCPKKHKKALSLGKKFPSTLIDPSIAKYLDKDIPIKTLSCYPYNDGMMALPYTPEGDWTEDRMFFITKEELIRFGQKIGAKIEY